MAKRHLVPRTFGLLTAAYGLYTLARPASLLRTCGYLDDGREPTSGGLALGRAIGVRDTVSGLALAFAPSEPALRGALMARVACDLSDSVGFGLTVPARHRPKVLAVTLGWAAACAATFPGLRR